MVRSFRHRGLRRFYERGDASLIRTDLRERVEVMMAQLDVAGTVNANWRIIFRFEHGDVYDVDLTDYH